MFGRWFKEILFTFGFVAFLLFMAPEENLPGPPRRAPPPDPPPVADVQPVPVPPPAAKPSTPARAPPVATRRLPPASANDPVIDIAATPARSGDSIGTAFVIDRGVWGTARHVTRDCGRVYLSLGGRWTTAGEVRMHRSADIAVLKTERSGGRALAVSDRPLMLGQSGYHIGYPQGQPAALQSQLVGRTLVNWPGAAKPEPTLTWVEVTRVPEFDGALGGISGGPVLDGEGRLIGITIASSVRRQRITTSLVESLQAVAPVLSRVGSPGDGIEPQTLAQAATRLRASDTVTMAYCQFDPNRPPPRRPRPAG